MNKTRFFTFKDDMDNGYFVSLSPLNGQWVDVRIVSQNENEYYYEIVTMNIDMVSATAESVSAIILNDDDNKGFSTGSFRDFDEIRKYMETEGDHVGLELLDHFDLAIRLTDFMDDLDHWEFTNSFGYGGAAISAIYNEITENRDNLIEYLEEVSKNEDEFYNDEETKTASAFLEELKEENPYTIAYKLAFDAYAWSSLEMWDVLTDCMINRMINESEAEMIAEDVVNEYNEK